MRHVARASRTLAVCAGLGLLGACATAASPSAMTLAPSADVAISAAQPGYQALRVGSVVGGSATSATGLSQVADADFQSALAASLRSIGYLAPDSGQGAYVVRAS